MRLIRHKLYNGGIFLTLVLTIGTFGYYTLATLKYHGAYWSLPDCFYMTVITLTTVGFGEVIDVANVPGSRFFTVLILVSGLGISAYFISTLTAFLVEGELTNVFWRKRMDKEIKKLAGHIILCGAGRVGRNVLQEFMVTGEKFVMVDQDAALIMEHQEDLGEFPAIVGDVTHDQCLSEAGVDRAAGVIVTLGDDKDNLCVVVTCKVLNPALRIVSRCSTSEFANRLQLLGAEVVMPNFIGGLRMASQMIRPRVVRYLDTMLRDKQRIVRIEEFCVGGNSHLEGVTLGEIEYRVHGNLLLLAVLNRDGTHHIYNPSSSYRINGGDTLIFQAEGRAMQSFRQKYS